MLAVLAVGMIFIALPRAVHSAAAAQQSGTPVEDIARPMPPEVPEPGVPAPPLVRMAPAAKPGADPQKKGAGGALPAAKPAGDEKNGDAVKSGQGAGENTARPAGPPPVPPRAVDAERLLRRGIVRVELRSEKQRLVTAPFSGTLAEILVKDGDLVEAGAPLARMDAGREERALADARKTLADALERLQAGGAEVGGGVSGRSERPEDRLARLADRVRQAEEQLEKTTLPAPFQARVTELRAVPGQYLKHGEAICELAEPKNLEIAASVPSVWVRNLAPGHIIWVLVDETGKSYEAVITRLGGKVDADTRTIRAYARFTGEVTELLPGMSGSADFWPPKKQ